jgi:tubulin--tyrosine ligase
MLLAPSPTPGGAPANHKFHLRTYVMLSGAYDVHLARTTLALFSSLPYSPPSSAEESLLPHLTNTCLQPPMSPGEVDETNVHLLWELEGRETMSGETLTRDVLEGIWADCGTVAGAAITAAVECGSVGLQLLPNCFEVRRLSQDLG